MIFFKIDIIWIKQLFNEEDLLFLIQEIWNNF